mmetsp:Transcript_7129/g.11965  ORF Transcript_7129/g.11965 Transcript_7129/m.11965 type:complete len:191 (-) Transcript_7129:80-652(-)
MTAEASKKRSVWTYYRMLLINHPFHMQVVQAAVLALLGNVCNQYLLARQPFDAALLTEQLTVNMLIAPVTIFWLQLLRKWRLHWVTAALIDQLGFNVMLNVSNWYFIAAVFRGGVFIGRWSIDLRRERFPSMLAYEPIWATRVKGLQLKLPATLIREKLVPAYLKGAWELLIRFVWNVIMAANLAGWNYR